MSTEQPAATQSPAAPAAGTASALAASPSPPTGAPAKGVDSLDTMLKVVHTAAVAVMFMGTRTDVPAKLNQLLKTAYDLLGDGQRAIIGVQADIAANQPLTIPPAVVPALPDWPTSPSAAPSLIQDVWNLVEPWASGLVQDLPGNTPAEQALKLWASNIMRDWPNLSTEIESVVNGSRAG